MRIEDKQLKMLKSELRLKPSYNELINEITKEEYKSKNIRDVFDRNAYYFRDSPLGTIYDNNTVDLRQQQFQKLLAEKKQPEIFDLTVGDTMDDLRDSALQTLETRMDDAQEQHEQEIERITERVSQQHLDDLRQRAKRARELEEAEFQSIVNSEPDDLPPLEPLMTEEEAITRTQGAQRGLMEREKEQRRQTMEDAEVSSTLPPSRSKKQAKQLIIEQQ